MFTVAALAEGYFAASDLRLSFSSNGGRAWAFSSDEGLLFSLFSMLPATCSEDVSDLRFSLLLFFVCLTFFDDALKNFALAVELLRFLT